MIPIPGLTAPDWYFRDLARAFEAAAEIRFGASYSVRYDSDEDRAPGTDFSSRFAGREDLVSLYAMASRQADPMSEFLCLYRVLEAADGATGTTFATAHLDDLNDRDFGVLPVIPHGQPGDWRNAFEVYRRRARQKLRRLRVGMSANSEVAAYLYRLRNSLAHGKQNVRTGDFGSQVEEVASALPIVKLLARVAVEG